MKTIIAGSRKAGQIATNKWDYDLLVKLIQQKISDEKLQITEVISGTANGPDKAGEIWADENDITITRFKPNWKLSKGAGFQTNNEMASHADCLIAIYDGKSSGTKHMIDTMTKQGKKVICIMLNS